MQADPPNIVHSPNIVHVKLHSHAAEAERREESSVEDSAEQQPTHSMGVHIGCHSRIKALEDKGRAIKLLASSRIQEQDQDYRKKMVQGVRKVSKAEAAAQGTTEVKKQRLIASTEELVRFKYILARNDQPGQNLRVRQAVRGHDQPQ